MGQSLVKNYQHLIFSTKNREPLLFPPIEERLHQYLGGICNALQSPAIKVGGYHDHIHILCMQSKNISMADLVKGIKIESSKWMKRQSVAYEHFHWQDGYGAFSLGRHEVERIIAYIENQHLHHGIITYKQEFLAFLKAYNVAYDERYIWD